MQMVLQYACNDFVNSSISRPWGRAPRLMACVVITMLFQFLGDSKNDSSADVDDSSLETSNRARFTPLARSTRSDAFFSWVPAHAKDATNAVKDTLLLFSTPNLGSGARSLFLDATKMIFLLHRQLLHLRLIIC